MRVRLFAFIQLAVGSLAAQSVPGLPACPDGPLFQVIPMAADDYVAFRPLGFLSVPIHFFPAKHSSFILALPGEPTPRREVRFPANAWVIDVLSTKFSTGNTGYQMQFHPCDKVRSYFYHLREVSPALQNAFDNADKRCFEQTFGDGSSVVKCQARLMFQVAAGDLAGYTGDGSSGLDFGLVDFRLEPQGFVEISHYPFDYPYYASPLDYYPPNLREMFEDRLASWDGTTRPTTEPKAGTHRLDVAGTAQGGWFFPGSNMRTNPDDMTPHLALVWDYIDPGQPVIVLGTTVQGARMGLYSFQPSREGDVNRPFREITPGVVYCYERLRSGRTAGQLPLSNLNGVLLILLVDENTLLVERQGDAASTCDSVRPWRLTDGAAAYGR